MKSWIIKESLKEERRNQRWKKETLTWISKKKKTKKKEKKRKEKKGKEK